MNDIKIFCLSLFNEDLNKIKSLNYIPVGLGDNEFDSDWLKDNVGDNISKKNKYYGEYTFHYWLWKNKLKQLTDNQWTGFCAYRRFWTNSEKKFDITTKEDFLSSAPSVWNDFDVILGNDIYMNGWTTMKIIKHGLRSFLLQPKFFLKSNRNLKLHFDSFHGYGNLEKAINLLEDKDRESFRFFMENQNYFNRSNMFICKKKEILENFYKTIFPWLNRCEKVFGFSNNGYGQTRIYAFLLERFVSYWFNKYAKVKVWPIAFFNINQENEI